MYNFKNLAPFLAMAGGSFGGKTDPLAEIDIDAEYEKIKAKKSALSSNLRKMVIFRKESMMGQKEKEYNEE